MDYYDERFTINFAKLRLYLARKHDALSIVVEDGQISVYSAGQYIGYVNTCRKTHPYFVQWKRGANYDII